MAFFTFLHTKKPTDFGEVRDIDGFKLAILCVSKVKHYITWLTKMYRVQMMGDRSFNRQRARRTTFPTACNLYMEVSITITWLHFVLKYVKHKEVFISAQYR